MFINNRVQTEEFIATYGLQPTSSYFELPSMQLGKIKAKQKNGNKIKIKKILRRKEKKTKTKQADMPLKIIDNANNNRINNINDIQCFMQ